MTIGINNETTYDLVKLGHFLIQKKKVKPCYCLSDLVQYAIEKHMTFRYLNDPSYAKGVTDCVAHQIGSVRFPIKFLGVHISRGQKILEYSQPNFKVLCARSLISTVVAYIRDVPR